MKPQNYINCDSCEYLNNHSLVCDSCAVGIGRRLSNSKIVITEKDTTLPITQLSKDPESIYHDKEFLQEIYKPVQKSTDYNPVQKSSYLRYKINKQKEKDAMHNEKI